ncbi:Efflux transporter, RND family, MFP subunit [Sulfitobacter noctilucicola]|uniref:RND family efflux transporter MFP subunit n=1 Tax=Sulfitobacter noctilucicola TaxID=1342301 RepID=A0A7W6M979_9RHOB|nr:efflux RND transporter periplasmic adaptor subunit [Sulfitobacter noctilucicola]KIN63741.1 Efflux transporter, RND family, MFP subunit [Sulfitobacter noctilucicola]MBB4174750.1 RND family efflux transporter MFP subunit [Sulfitobacter noctilucicola]
MKTLIKIATLMTVALIPFTATAEQPIVKIEAVSAGDEDQQRVFFGRVVARETVDLAFQVGGQIVEIPVEEGAFMATGDLVAMMDQLPFELALEEAAAQQSQAERTVTRYKQLVGSAVAETNLQDAQTQLDLSAIALKNAERELANATLHAPFDGIVAARLEPNYATVAAGTPVVRLHDMSDLRIEIDVPEQLFQRAGQDAEVTLFAQFLTGDKQYPLEIREFNAETEQVGQTYTITLGMEPQEGLNILPGSSAKVTAFLGKDVALVEVPASAVIIENDNSTSVMVFTPTGALEGTVNKTPVEVQPTENGNVAVLSGLEPGQEYVAIAADRLTDGQAVRRFTGFGD